MSTSRDNPKIPIRFFTGVGFLDLGRQRTRDRLRVGRAARLGWLSCGKCVHLHQIHPGFPAIRDAVHPVVDALNGVDLAFSGNRGSPLPDIGGKFAIDADHALS